MISGGGSLTYGNRGTTKQLTSEDSGLSVIREKKKRVEGV